MMSVRSPQCSMPSSSPFLKEESASCMRIRDMTGKRFASRSASGVTLQESHGRSADAGVLRRIDAGSWKRRTPGSTDSESSWSDMRNYLKATRRSSISLLRSSVGGRWQLFTDKSLLSVRQTPRQRCQALEKTVSSPARQPRVSRAAPWLPTGISEGLEQIFHPRSGGAISVSPKGQRRPPPGESIQG